MTPAQLATHGRSLYGSGWKRPLAASLGVTERTIQRWASGSLPIPEGVTGDVERLRCAQDVASATARDVLGAGYHARVYRRDG